MCGIALELAHECQCQPQCTPALPTHSLEDPWMDRITPLLSRRGPDHLDRITITPKENISLSLMASVLHLRGPLTKQPVYNPKSGNILSFNGEIFEGLELKGWKNDTSSLSDALEGCGCVSEVLCVLRKLRGPFALAFFHSGSHSLFYARDRIGRRSLLISEKRGIGENGKLVNVMKLASVAGNRTNTDTNTDTEGGWEWKELPADGIYCRDLAVDGCVGSVLFPWKEQQEVSYPQLDPPAKPHTNTYPHSDPQDPRAKPHTKTIYTQFLAQLSQSIRERILHKTHSSSIAILYSGGIDSQVIAALTALHLPLNSRLDLLNVAFGHNPNKAPDRQTARNGLLELRSFAHRQALTTSFHLVEIDLTLSQVESSRERIESLIYPSNTVMDFNIGTVLWYASRGSGRVLKEGQEYQLVRGRECRYACEEKESEDSPEQSTQLEYEPYQSSAKILFSGLGADELLGGYGRHRTVFRKGGCTALEEELVKDQKRLWKRNLGRDDRLFSDWGKEVRHPFLEEKFIGFVKSCAMDDICDLRLDPGIGDKRVLRQAARKLGLTRGCALEKRAIQFGTKIANKKIAGYVQLKEELRTREIVAVQDGHLKGSDGLDKLQFLAISENSALSEKEKKWHRKQLKKQSQNGGKNAVSEYLSKKANKRRDKPNFE